MTGVAILSLLDPRFLVACEECQQSLGWGAPGRQPPVIAFGEESVESGSSIETREARSRAEWRSKKRGETGKTGEARERREERGRVVER